MWDLTACKMSVNLAFLKWNDFLWVQRYIKKSFHFWSSSKTRDLLKFYRLSDATFYDCINTIYQFIKKGKRKVQGVPQSQTAALPRPQEEEETDKYKQAQTEQTYEKH